MSGRTGASPRSASVVRRSAAIARGIEAAPQVARPRPEVEEEQAPVGAHDRFLPELLGVRELDELRAVRVPGTVDHDPGEADRGERVERLGRRFARHRRLPVAVAAVHRAPAPAQRVGVQPAAHLVVRPRALDEPGLGEDHVRELEHGGAVSEPALDAVHERLVTSPGPLDPAVVGNIGR